MSSSKENNNTVRNAVIIALIAGGSSPWWFEKLFPPSKPDNLIDMHSSGPSRNKSDSQTTTVLSPPVVEKGSKDITIKRSGQLDVTGDGNYIVKWRRLSLKYDGSYLEYDFDADFIFPSCPTCITQLIIWIDGDHNECIQRSVNISNESIQGHFAVPQTLARDGNLPVSFVVKLESNCSDAIRLAKNSNKEIIGTITSN